MESSNQIWQIQGKIFNYDQQFNLVAFQNNIQSHKIVIFIAGLSDNLLSIPFNSGLSKIFKQNKIKLIIPQFRSMPQYRIHKIEDDIEDLHKIVNLYKNETIILLGHSTGCQISLLYLKKYGNQNIKKVFLQAPCSDVQYEQSINQNLKQSIQLAKKTKYFQYNDQIWLSQRFLSLYQRNNTQDLFSSYSPDENFIKWKNFGIPIYSIVSQKDEYVIQSNIQKLTKGSQVFIIKDANHNLFDQKCQKVFFDVLISNI